MYIYIALPLSKRCFPWIMACWPQTLVLCKSGRPCTWLFAVYRGWKTTRLYNDYNKPRIPDPYCPIRSTSKMEITSSIRNYIKVHVSSEHSPRIFPETVFSIETYSWWKKSCTSWYGKFSKVLYILAVVVQDFFHQQCIYIPQKIYTAHLANGPWKKSLNFIFPTKYGIPKSLKG